MSAGHLASVLSRNAVPPNHKPAVLPDGRDPPLQPWEPSVASRRGPYSIARPAPAETYAAGTTGAVAAGAP